MLVANRDGTMTASGVLVTPLRPGSSIHCKEGDVRRISERSLGTVKWFSRVRGYGFIEPEDGCENILVHYSAIVGGGFRNLELGQRVEFTVESTEKGLQAAGVTRLD